MSSTPIAGWYTDPADASRHRFWDGGAWTDKTRPGGVATVLDTSTVVGMDAKPGRSSGRVIGIVAAVVLGVGALAGLGIALTRGGDGETPQTDVGATPRSQEPAADVIREKSSTAGWVTYTSRSGSLEYLIDPAWTDYYTPEDELAMIGSTEDIPDTELELAGFWLHSGSILSGGTPFFVLAVDDGIGSLSLRFETQMFASSLTTTVDDYSEVFSEGMTTSSGDEAWRLDFEGTTFDLPVTGTIVSISHDTTVVVAYALSNDDFDAWASDFLAMVDSLEVVHPPVSP